jgi:hypothetical protein
MTLREKKLKFFKTAKKLFSSAPHKSVSLGRNTYCIDNSNRYMGMCMLLYDYQQKSGLFENKRCERFTKAQLMTLHTSIQKAVNSTCSMAYFDTNADRLNYINRRLKALK